MEKLALYGGEALKQNPFPKWPMYSEREIELLTEVVESQAWWRMTGSKVREFEEKFARLHNAQWAIAVTNGTHAIELAMAALEIGEGDEVIVPAFTFIATATAPLYANAVPVPVDVDPVTFCLDPEAFKAAITPKTKVVIPVHMAGHACDMERICQIAREHGIKIIEDASHAQGAEWDGKKIGTFGDLATFSFQNGKLMTSGEGGLLMGNDPKLREKAYLIHNVGRPDRDRVYAHLYLGTNYRMTEFQGAVLLAQLERLEKHNQVREENATRLNELLKEVPGIEPQGRNPKVSLNTHYMYMFYYDAKEFGGMDRRTFVDALIAEGVPAFVAYPPVHHTEFFTKHLFRSHLKEDYDWNHYQTPHAKRIGDTVVWLPHQTMIGSAEDIEDIYRAIVKIQKYAVQAMDNAR